MKRTYGTLFAVLCMILLFILILWIDSIYNTEILNSELPTWLKILLLK